MPHTTKAREKLLKRVRRLEGQVGSVERALDEKQDCSIVLHRLAACRGAIASLMKEVIEGHIRDHVLAPASKPTQSQQEAGEDLIEVLRSYLK
jgi:DNA-binding FrmR family transcriptional regulator